MNDIVQVIGVECARLGEEVCAWIKLEDNSHPITADDIQQFCKNKVINITTIIITFQSFHYYYYYYYY